MFNAQVVQERGARTLPALLGHELAADLKTGNWQCWLCNAEKSKDRLADLGYFMGYASRRRTTSVPVISDT